MQNRHLLRRLVVPPYRARTGKNWHHATIRGIICNLTYTGILRSGESRSQVLRHLQLISQEMFDAAQRIRTSRANAAEQDRTVPRNIGGQSLLSGNVFCGHCGARLALTTNGKAYPCAEDPNRIVKRVRYICYGKTRKQTECTGQTVLNALNAQYEDIISWAEMYDQANLEAKKMIVNCLIKRVDVYRGYKLHIDFNIDLEQFSFGKDIVTIAA